jgi:glutathione S-transferase
MDRLYAVSGSTSLVAAILLEECEHPYTLELMALNPEGAGDATYAQLTPWRQVPALVTSHGLLTEVIAIAHYLDWQCPRRKLLPQDPWQRIETLRWYSCLATAIQPYVRCLIRPERFVGEQAEYTRAIREHTAQLIVAKLGLLDAQLANRQWYVGDEFGPVDALLVTMTGWAERLRLPIEPLRHLLEHAERCRARPSWQRAADRHGLVPNIVRHSKKEDSAHMT